MNLVSKHDLTGDLEELNVPTLRLILMRQYDVQGYMDITHFQEDHYVGDDEGGFNWSRTVEGDDFWSDVLSCSDVSLTARRYRNDIAVFPTMDSE